MTNTLNVNMKCETDKVLAISLLLYEVFCSKLDQSVD